MTPRAHRPSTDATVPGPLGVTVALTATLAFGVFALLLTASELLVHPKPLPPPLNLGQRQGVETALYLGAFGVVLPLALLVVPRLVARIARNNAASLDFVAPGLAATLAGGLLTGRLLDGRLATTLECVGAWSIGAVLVLRRACGPAWPAAHRLARRNRIWWALCGASCLALVLGFTSLRSIDPAAAGLGATAGAVVLFLHARRAGRPVRTARLRWRVLLDAGVVVLILLAVPDLVVFGSPGRPETFLVALEQSVAQYHQDYVLGPVNVMLHGGSMLVDTASQYGVGSLYFLAGFFQVAPVGYGTLALLDGILFASLFAAAYAVLRLAGTSRALSAAALAVGVVGLIYNLLYSVGSLPAQHGPLRFGMPMLLILAAVIEARWARRGRAARIAQAAVVGVSSIWALEAFAYTLATFAALAAFEAWASPEPRRLRRLAGRAVGALVGCILAHLGLIAATLILAGELPDYGRYLAFLGSFLGGKVGEITYDFSRWSPGIAVGGAGALSAIALILLVRRRPVMLERERPALVALCGTTAYGTALFSYFVNRSADHILPYVSLPVLMAGALWLGLLVRGALGGTRLLRTGGLAFALGLSIVLTSVAWSSVPDRFSRSALGHLLPGEPSARTALHRLWHLPALDARAPRGQQVLARFMPEGRPAYTIVSPDLEVEILMRSGRRNAFPLDFATEDGFASDQYLPGLRRAVAKLRAGDRVLTQVRGLENFAALRHDPARDPIARPLDPAASAAPTGRLVPIQEWLLELISRRFALHVVHRDEQGFVVVALAPLR